MARDLRRLSLRDASLALARGVVRDHDNVAVVWTPGYQVFPISALLAAYFHSAQYAAHVTTGFTRHRYHVDAGAHLDAITHEPPCPSPRR